MANSALDALLVDVARCRACVEAPAGVPLPHDPRPIVQLGAGARIAVFSQAPGARAHASGLPFTDPSGDRLRDWMGLSTEAFYDASRVAILPMGFCFPGNDAKGGDMPPRKECAPLWRTRLLAQLEKLELILLVGQHAQRWHLGPLAEGGTTATVMRWREIHERPGLPRALPLPHPSWRNNGWIRKNRWFSDELLPVLKAEVARQTAGRVDVPDPRPWPSRSPPGCRGPSRR